MPSLPPTVFTKRIEIRWRDMDAFKHVNNAVYLTYLEETRDEWFLEVLGNGLLLNDFVLARCAIDYRSPVTQDDGRRRCRAALHARRALERHDGRAHHVPGDGRLAAEAEAVLVHYDWETGKSRPLTEEIATAFGRWLLCGEIQPVTAAAPGRARSSSALTLSQAARPAASGAPSLRARVGVAGEEGVAGAGRIDAGHGRRRRPCRSRSSEATRRPTAPNVTSTSGTPAERADRRGVDRPVGRDAPRARSA